MGRKITVVELEPLVAVLKGHETIQPGPFAKRLTRKFYHKSGTELRLEASQKVKLLTTLTTF